MNTPPPNRVRKVPNSPESPSSRSPKRRKAVEAESSSPKIKLHFAGRVYRTPDESLSPKKIKYAAGQELLGAPDELRIDEAYDALQTQQTSLLASPTLRPRTDRPATPKSSKTPKSTALSDSDLEIEPPSSPFKTPIKSSPQTHKASPSKQYNLTSSNAPLPESYNNLLTLHTAFERALMLHLTTEGRGGRIASAVAEMDESTSKRIRLENLATYTQLRPMVERGSGKRFGAKEFSQLLWLWNDTPSSSPTSDPFFDSEPVLQSLLGFVVTKTLELSKATGKKAWAWGIGIELDLKRNNEAVERSLSIQNSPSSSAKKPSPSKMVGKREGMSVVALWSQGAEERRNQIRCRLGDCVIQQHDVSFFYLSSFIRTDLKRIVFHTPNAAR